MPSLSRPLLILLLFAGAGARAVDFDWEALPPLPEPLYSFYAGVHNGAVIVAGGASMNAADFVARDTVYVLEPGADAWREAGRLDRARAGRGAVTNAEGLWILGGTDGVEYYRDLVRIRYVNGALEIQEPSPLQAPMPDGAIRLEAAIAGDYLYAYARPKSGGDPQLWRIRWAVDADTWEVVQPPPPAALNVEEIAARGSTLYTFARDDERRLRIHAFGPAPVWTEITANGADAGIVTATPFGLNHLIVWSGDAQTAHAYHLVTDSWLDIPGLPAQAVEIVPTEDGSMLLFSGAADGTVYRGRLRTIVRGFAPLDYAALAAYFAVLVAIGFYFSRRENTTEAFFLGGRKVPWWAVGLSLFGTSLSAITYISIPATAYSGNWVTMVFNLTVMIIGPVLIWWYIPKLREIPVTTAYEYLERRFNLATRLYGSVVFIIFQMGRMSIVLYLPAIALSASTGLNVYFCIVTMGVLATLYTVLGGIEAVIWTDVIQTIVLMFGAVLALYFIYSGIDVPVGEAFRTAWEADKYRAFNWTWDTTAAAVWIVILGGCFGNAYPIMADQTMVQRYFTTATDREAGRALWVHVWMALPAQLLFFSIGTGLWLFFRTHPGLIEPNMPSDYVMPVFVMEMFPVGLKGVILAGLFAASMSSLDSSMNSLAAVFVNDYYRRFARNVNERTALNLARIITLGAGVFGTCGALYVVGVAQDTPVFRIFLDLLGLVGGGLAAIFALGAFTKTANAPGALTGGLVSAALMYYVRESVAVNTLFYGFISFVSAFLVGYAVSMVTRKSPQEA